jgi:chitinase
MQTEEIDWDAFTHLIYFHILPNPDGTLSGVDEIDYISGKAISSIVSAARHNNVPILFSIGGWGTYDGFSGAISPGNRDRFINNLITLMTTWGFDGIDINMEPINNRDVENYIAFIEQLHYKLQELETPLGYLPILTAATKWQPGMYAHLSDKFDQINIMTYDYSGAWPDWITWHNSPLYSGGQTFPGINRELPSADGDVNRFLNAGIPREKLGIGMAFTGYLWEGFVLTPLDEWITPPEVTANIPWYEIMQNHYREGAYQWDDIAKVPYLSITGATPLDYTFISYENERSIQEKFNYIREKKLGGTIIWEIGEGFDQTRPQFQRNPLLQAVKQELKN